MATDSDFADSLHPVVADYRRRLAAQGLVDSEDDYGVVQFIGRSNPKLLEEQPDFGELYSKIREANAPSLGAEVGRALKRGTIGLASTAVGGASLFTGSDYLKRKAAALDLMASDPDLAPTIPTLEDIRPGASTASKVFSRDALRYAASKVGEVAPSIAESVATAAIGAAAGTAAAPGPGTIAGGAAGLIEKSLIKAAIRRLTAAGVETTAENVAKAAKAIGAFRGGVAANAAGSVLLNSGDVASEGADTGTSITLGLISAIPDTILPAYVLSKMFPGVAKEAAKEAGKTFLARNARKIAELAGVPAEEFGQEAFQQAVNIVARNVKDGKDPLTFDDANMREIREAGIAGAAGGLLAAPGVMMSGARPEAPAAVRPPPAAPLPPAAESATTVPPPPAVTPPSPVARVRAMPPEQQTARLIELEANVARTGEEDAEYQLLRAVAPRVAPIVQSAPQIEQAPPDVVQIAPQTPLPEPAEPLPPAAAGTPVAPAPGIAEAAPAAAVESRNMPDWAREEMLRRGLDPARPLNDVDVAQPSVREAVQADPTLTPEQKARVLETGSPTTPVPIGPRDATVSTTKKQMPPTWRITIQEPVVAGVPKSGYTQIDMLDAAGENAGSTSPEELLAQGYEVPDLTALKTGQYSVAEVFAPQAGAPTAPAAAEVVMPTPASAEPPVFTRDEIEVGKPQTSRRKRPNGTDGEVRVEIKAPGKITSPENWVRLGDSNKTRATVEARLTFETGKAQKKSDAVWAVRSGSMGSETLIAKNLTYYQAIEAAKDSVESAMAAPQKSASASSEPTVQFAGVDYAKRGDKWYPDDATGEPATAERAKVLEARLAANPVPPALRTSTEPTNPALRTSTEPTNPAVQANRTKQFQATMGRMVSNGADVQAMSRELLMQQTGEVLQQQIAALQTRLAQATTEPQRIEIQAQIDIRQQRLAEVQQMRGVTYSPFHIAIAMDDVMNASVDNLVTLLHEAAESLTMRLTPAQQGAVFRAVEATTAEMTAKMQAAAKNTGATIGNVGEPSELLAETMAQKLAAEGIQESPSLAKAIVRWIKEIYYRVAMAAQRAFGAEPNLEMALNWYENQLRRELGGDYEFAFANLLDRFLPEQNRTRAAQYVGRSRTPGGIVDFIDPITNKQRQPWVEPLSEAALDWNMRFSTAEPNPGDADGIPQDEAVDRQTAASYNAEIEFLTKLKTDIAPDMSDADFWQQVGRGEKSPAELLAVLEGKRAGVSEAKIGGERMTEVMNGFANYQTLLFIRGIQTKNLASIAKMQTAVKQAEDSFTKHAQELNRLESDVRNAELHETELKKRARGIIDGLVKSYSNGLRTASRLGQMVREEEELGPNDPLPQFYDQVFNNLIEGGIPLFEYVEAIATLDMPLATMTPGEVWKAIRDNADTSPKLRELSRNKPLAMTVSVMASEGARQVDQIQLRRVSGKEFLDIRAELEGIRNATEAQLRAMLKTIDEKNNAKGLRQRLKLEYLKGLRQRLKLEYLKERRALQRASDRMAAAETRIDLLERAKPAIDAKVGESEQAIGGIFSEWQPVGGADFAVMRSKDDGTFQRAVRRLAINSDGSFVDSDGVLNDIAQNMQWLRANQERAGQKEYQRIEQQTYALANLDVARAYQAANFGKVMGFIDAFVRPLQAIARQAGHSSGARIVGQFNKYEFINRSGAKALTNAAKIWDHAWQSVQKSTGIKDHGQFRRQVFNPVMFYLGVNPGLDQSQAIRAATREARKHLATEPTADFDARFERFLLATKAVNDELLSTAEQQGVMVSDPKLGGDLRRALSRGWLTGMRGMNAGVVVTLIHDMEGAGWKLAFDPDGKTKKVVKGITFDAVDMETAENADTLRGAIAPYFTPGVLDRWLKPFINKPGESVFSYEGRDIPQLDVQDAWAKSGGDVLNWIDNLGQKVDVTPEEGASSAATFRVAMLKQIDHLFAWEARMAYEAEVTPDLFADQGTKMHVLMDARVNDLMPEEHVDFAMHDPTSTQQMLGQIAFHGAFGRNGQALVANLRELGTVTQAKKFAFESLQSTTTEGRKREAKERGYDYDDLNRAVKHNHDILELKGEIESAMGVNNIYGPLHDARAGLEILGFMVGQAVDQPKTGALNFLSIGARPFAMHSLGPRVLKATAMSYAELAKNTFGGLLRDFGLDIIRMSDMAKETGEVEGKAFRRLPWSVAISDIGREGSLQNGAMDRFVVAPLRMMKSVQKKGVGPGLAAIPGLGTMARFSTEGAIANNRGQVYLMQEIINNGINYFSSHPEDLANPAFRFDKESLKLRADKGVYDWFRNKTVEYNMGPIEAIVRGAMERQQAGERTITTEMVEQLAQMNSQELDGASSINTSPAGLAQNPALRLAMPLLRWPLWMMHAAHNGLANADGKADFKSMIKGLGRLAAWNLPLGLAFTFMIDEYDDKILGKKNAMPEVEKIGAVPFVGPALALATTDRSVPQELLAIGQRMIRTGNIYGLGADMMGAVITPFDPSSGQRLFSLDQRVLIMSQLLNLSQAARNMVAQGGTATWGSVYRPLVASIGGNGMLNSLGVVNNMLGLDNQESRQNNRINAARWVNTAAKELDIPTKSSSGFSTPSAMSVWTREMQMAAQANDRMGFMEAYRRALTAAREHVAEDDRIPIGEREKEAMQRVMQSWRTRNPFSGLAATPTPEQINQLLRIMDDDGRADVQEAMRRFESYTQFIAPSATDQYLNRRIRPPNPMAEIERMRRQAAGAMFAP